MSILSKHLLKSSAAIASLMMLAATCSADAAAPPSTLFDGTAQPSVLKHLPAGHDEMVFRGETAQRSWSVYLGRAEVDHTKSFQLAMKNTVLLLPERSFIRLSINNHVLATVPARAPNITSLIPVTIPPGVLVPGFNKVDVSVSMTHRVDCSTGATYELWTALDPAQTGFVVPASTAGTIRGIDELAGEPLAEDGTTRIYLRMSETGDEAAIGRAGRFIEALVSRGGLTRPVVETGPGSGQGPGVDVVLTTGPRENATKGLNVLGVEDGVTFARDPGTSRLVLIVSSANTADLDRDVETFASKVSGLVVPTRAGEAIIDGETQKSFSELGFKPEGFAGRHYTSSLDIVLPSDFYPANYDKARLLIDGAYAANLNPDSSLVFRVNGTLVSTLHLGPDRGGMLTHEMVELPLRFFHPGHNEIGIEGNTATSGDRQCNTIAMTDDVRLTLSGSSELQFPRFAHLGTMPQIPGAIAELQRTDPESHVDVYLPDANPSSVASGLTVLANMSVGRDTVPSPLVHLGRPSAQDAPGIVVAPLAALPAALSGPIEAKTGLARIDPFASTTGSAVAAHPSTAVNESNGVAVASRDGALATASDDMLSPNARPALQAQAVLANAQRFAKTMGFFFGTGQDGHAVPVKTPSLVVSAVSPQPENQRLAGMDVPRFTPDKAQWLVVTAPNAGLLQNGLIRLVSDGQWKELNGETVSLDVDEGRISSVQPSQVLYVMPSHVVLSDIRPILGGIISNHIALSLSALMLLMTLLGVSTHTLIRRMGSK